jgi:cytochrome c556
MSARPFLKLCAVLAPAVITAVVFAADAKSPADVQKARHEHYEDLGDSFKSVRDLSHASTPDWVAIEKAAAEVNEASVDQQRWFPHGSGPEAGKTRALPEIWSKSAEFTDAQKKFTDAAAKLLAAAQTHDPAALQGAFKNTGGACKNCHDTFRGPED